MGHYHSNGFINLNKPPGQSSFAFVSVLRRLTGIRRVGHGGTLDPAAEGVLPLCIGQATRMSELLLTASKEYHARVRLGVITDTYDADGEVVEERDPSGVTLGQVQQALRAFEGRVLQVPPMYSALKRQGRPLYELARAGVEVEREPREVTVYRIGLTLWEPPFLELSVECSRGTYIRSIAHDLGLALGCGGHLQHLVRTRVGPFRIEDAVGIDEIKAAAEMGYWQAHLYPLDWVALGLPAAILDTDSTLAVQEGRLLTRNGPPPADATPPPEGMCRAYSDQGDLVALLAYDQERDGWQPSKVFSR